MRQRLEPETRRRSLVELAIELFSGKAYDAVSTRDIARLAGISRTLVYHYFSNKQGLYIAAVKEVVRRLDGITAPNPDLDFDDALRDALTRFFAFIEAHPRIYRARGAGGTSLHRESEALVDQLRHTTVDRVLAFRGVDAPDPGLRVLVYGWVASVEFAGAAWLDQPDVESAPIVEQLSVSVTALLDANI